MRRAVRLVSLVLPLLVSFARDRRRWLLFGTGAVKGFALTLGIGVAVSFFTAVVVTQMLLRGALEFPALRKRSLYGVEEREIDRVRESRSAPVRA